MKSLQIAFFKWWRCPQDIPDSFDQGSFLDLTLRSSIYMNHPIPSSKARQFFKRLILQLEDLGTEVQVEYYDFLLRHDILDGVHRTYWPRGLERSLSLSEDPNLITGGTTGLRSWSAALALSEYLLIDHPYRLQGKIVLEMGSGAGYLGLSIAVSGLPSEVILTDGHPKVLELLSCNNESNGSLARVLELNWSESMDEDDISGDVIVASDVVFDPSLLGDLVRTLMTVLRSDGCAFISCTERNVATLGVFEGELNKTGLIWEIESVITEDHRVDEGDPILPVRIYMIRKTNRT